MKSVPTVSTATRWSGCWFVFNDENLQFALWVTPTGKEALYVDGRLVSECLPITYCAPHAFRKGRTLYEVSVQIAVAAPADMACSFKRNGALRGFLRTRLVQPSLGRRLAVAALVAMPALLSGPGVAAALFAMTAALAAFLYFRFAAVTRIVPDTGK